MYMAVGVCAEPHRGGIVKLVVVILGAKHGLRDGFVLRRGTVILRIIGRLFLVLVSLSAENWLGILFLCFPCQELLDCH